MSSHDTNSNRFGWICVAVTGVWGTLWACTAIFGGFRWQAAWAVASVVLAGVAIAVLLKRERKQRRRRLQTDTLHYPAHEQNIEKRRSWRHDPYSNRWSQIIYGHCGLVIGSSLATALFGGFWWMAALVGTTVAYVSVALWHEKVSRRHRRQLRR